jgi:protein-tyrosine-phosphatase/molybdopterin converting factor small subunit
MSEPSADASGDRSQVGPTETDVVVRYWAAARAAAGVECDRFPVAGATSLAQLLDDVRARHRDRPRLVDVVAVCSVLVGDRPVGLADPADVLVRAGETVELLPPFAGGSGGRPEPPALSEMSVLFVCTANICRSAFAELLARHQLEGREVRRRVSVASAGVRGWVDHPMDEVMAAELRERGVGPLDFRSRPIDAQLVQEADLILTAEAGHRRYILQEWPGALRRTYSLGQFARGVESLDEGLELPDLLSGVTRSRPTASSDDDVVDPYRRGAAAAAAAAGELERLLLTLLPRLAPAPEISRHPVS